MLRTRVGRPKLKLVHTAAGIVGGGVGSVRARQDDGDGEAEAMLARALPAGAHEAMGTLYYRRQTELRRTADNVDRLRYAVVDLATIDLSPSQLIEALSPSFDQPIVRDRLERALDCLTRFAEEWRRREAE